MKNAIAALLIVSAMFLVGNVHAEEELAWTPTHLLGAMVIGHSDYFVQEDGSEAGVFTVVLEKNTTDNALFDQVIVIGIPGSDQVVVIGIPAGADGVATMPTNLLQSADGGTTVSATPIVSSEPLITTFASVAHIDHWSESEAGSEDPAMEFDPIPEPPPEGDVASWELNDGVVDGVGLVGESPEPGGNPPGPNMYE